MKTRIWFEYLLVGSCILCVAPRTSQTKPTAPTTFARSRSSHSIITNTISSTLYSSLVRGKRSVGGLPIPTPIEIPIFCDRFIIPITDNNTFFSPMDPRSITNTYPQNADCVFVLEAPPGFLIRLDFRNKFHIEPSDGCEFDYLEIRDGKHGFSKLLGQYCGTDFPPMIYSSERYLWLHFHSDENIEYDGFQAVYEFLPRPTSSFLEETACVFVYNGTEGFVNRTDIDEHIVETVVLHSLNLDCLWTIEVEHGSKILLSFLTFELERKNDCDSNFIDIFGEVTDIPSRLKNFCGVIAESVVSKTNKLHIRFFAEKHAVKSKFVILYTSFRPKAKGDECHDDEFDCDDDTCISKELECNGRVNCKFLKDESECEDEVNGNSDHLIIIIIVFSLILGAMTTAFLINCIRKLIRDQKIIREHIRQSKESKLDEAGRISLKRSLENINRITPRKQLSQQRSIHILDDESSRYYQEQQQQQMSAMTAQVGSRIDMKTDNNYRNQEVGWIKDILDTSLKNEKLLQDASMCDMACQTRESLFAPVFKNKIIQAPTQSTGTLRFSTFGYDSSGSGGGGVGIGNVGVCIGSGNSKTLLRRQSMKEKSETIANALELEDFTHLTDIPPPPPPSIVCSKHDPSKKNIKMEESRIFVDIRNSAPDVIIMTSH